jgi:hypothetical protein
MAEADFVVCPLPPFDVQVGEMLEKSREIAITLWPQDHVPMIWHHAVAADSHPSGSKSFRDDLDEGLVVGARRKNCPSPYGPV